MDSSILEIYTYFKDEATVIRDVESGFYSEKFHSLACDMTSER